MQRARYYEPLAGWLMIVGGYVCIIIAGLIAFATPIAGLVVAGANSETKSPGAPLGTLFLGLLVATIFGNAGTLMILCGVIRLAVQPLMRQNEQLIYLAGQANRLASRT